jgi:hypothetical protein
VSGVAIVISSSPTKYGSPFSRGIIDQTKCFSWPDAADSHPICTRIVFSPTEAILLISYSRSVTHFSSSAYVNQVFQWSRISDIVSFLVDIYAPYVHSSTTQSGLVENKEGVIHGYYQLPRDLAAYLQHKPGYGY